MTTDNMIGFRTDANETIATGHVMRCMTIADKVKALGEEVIFFTSDNGAVDYLKERGFESVVLNSDWENPLEETDSLVELCEKYEITAMLFDSYRFTKEYFDSFRSKSASKVYMAYIDDLYEDVYPVDMIVNYNGYHTNFPYSEKYSENVKLLLGPMYVPLRTQFEQQPQKPFHTPMQVLIASGGGDRYDVLPSIMEQIKNRKEFKNVDFAVILGNMCKKENEIDRLSYFSHNMFVYKNVTDMAGLMDKCDVAVSAAGTMLYELSAMSVPTIFYVTADNQKHDADYFADSDRMIDGGDVREDKETVIGRILDELSELIEDKQRRKKMGEVLSHVTDGKGADRIARALCGVE